ncbi:MAG: acyl carrier protein [Gammaproteobacteria bacterium]
MSREDYTIMADDLREQIRAFILENYLFTSDPDALGLDDSLLGRGIVDSTGMLEIIFFIEEQLGVKVKDEEMIPDNLDSVNKITNFVLSKRQAA